MTTGTERAVAFAMQLYFYILGEDLG